MISFGSGIRMSYDTFNPYRLNPGAKEGFCLTDRDVRPSTYQQFLNAASKVLYDAVGDTGATPPDHPMGVQI